jgi:predicted ABC-type ATPase/DNA-binding transcriptional ArsR family regulator
MHKIWVELMFSPNQIAVLGILARETDKMYSMSDLGRALSKAPGVFQRGLNSLENQGFITSIRKGNRRLMQLNSSHPLALEITRIALGAPCPLPSEIYMNFPSGVSGKIAEPHEIYKASELKILIIAGPNGAGKTTFARELIEKEATKLDFINADYIAHGLSPFSPEAAAMKAGKIMIRELHNHIDSRKSIALETTLSGQRYAKMIPEWQKKGYRIKLIFLSLPSVELAIRRVGIRVSQGGHNIPIDTIRRRYESGLNNFNSIYKPLTDAWALYDSALGKPILIDRGE